MSVRDLADAAGVNKNTVLRLEKGLTPSYATLARVCEALGVHVAQLTQPEPDEENTIALHDREQAVRRLYPSGLAANGAGTAGSADGAVVLFQDGAGMPSFAACPADASMPPSWNFSERANRSLTPARN
jgi:transcriptional regulator with XRE-family HTH domain